METGRLVENITGQIKEIQFKLGFTREVIRLYYPVESMCRLLGTEYRSGEELLKALGQEKDLFNTGLGSLQFALAKDRIEVCIPIQGAVYVHEQIPDPPFLVGLIALFQEKHDLTCRELCGYFEKTGKEFVCKQMEPGAEFDYVLYFPEGEPDGWFYCVRMEMGHTVYHRFSREDWMGR